MNVSYIMTEDSLTIAFIESGQTYTIGRTNPNWDAVVEKLNSEDYDSLEDLLSPKAARSVFASIVPVIRRFSPEFEPQD